MCAIAWVCLYILINVDINSFILARLGEDDTGNWNANNVGIMMSVGILTAVYLISEVKPMIIKAMLVIFIAGFLYLETISGSRKAILMLVLGLCALVLLNGKGKLLLKTIVIALIGIITFYIIINVPAIYNIIGWRIEGMINGITGNGESDSSYVLRQNMIASAWQLFLKNPILGCGIDNFRFFNPVMKSYSHNNFLEIAADSGIIGLIAYYGIYVYIILDYFRAAYKKDKLCIIIFVIFAVFLISQWGLVSYYDLLQNIILCIYISYARLKHQQEENAAAQRNNMQGLIKKV